MLNVLVSLYFAIVKKASIKIFFLLLLSSHINHLHISKMSIAERYLSKRTCPYLQIALAHPVCYDMICYRIEVVVIPKLFTFLTFSNNLTVMFPVPGPISKQISVGRRAA